MQTVNHKPMQLELIKPDDFHLHLREGSALAHTISASCDFARALIMPNLKTPLTTINLIDTYNKDIASCKPTFKPLFTFFLNPSVPLTDLELAAKNDSIVGAKLYPQGVTTQSDKGARDIKALFPHFEVMAQHGLVLQIHGETQHDDIFDRERAFIEGSLTEIVKNFPRLKIVLEHTSTQAACDFVKAQGENIAATITVHHLLYNRNDMLTGGIKPHLYCLPILKRRSDQSALLDTVKSGNPKFFLGTDSAPHAITDKESSCGCAGVFSAPYAMPLYAKVFEDLNALDKLEAFASKFGADFYRLPYNKEAIVLEKKSQSIPDTQPLGDSSVRPIEAGNTLSWSVCHG